MSGRLEVVRRIHELWASGGEPTEEGLIAEDVVYVNPPDAIDSGVRRGIEGWRAAMRNFGGALTITRMEVVELREVGERVLALVDLEIRGRGSGVEGARSLGWVFDVRGGRVVRFAWFTSHDAARAAVEAPERADEDPLR